MSDDILPQTKKLLKDIETRTRYNVSVDGPMRGLVVSMQAMTRFIIKWEKESLKHEEEANEGSEQVKQFLAELAVFKENADNEIDDFNIWLNVLFVLFGIALGLTGSLLCLPFGG